jgi:hypothetical protein
VVKEITPTVRIRRTCEGGAACDKGMEECRVIADVHLVRVRGPAAHGLNSVVVDPGDRQRGGSSRAKRVSHDIHQENILKLGGTREPKKY